MSLHYFIVAKCSECGGKYEWGWKPDYPAAMARRKELAVEQHNKAHEQFEEGTKQ